jgi:hypothetical protein
MPFDSTFYHWLIDSYLERWQKRNPNVKPFLSIKIFKFDPTRIKNCVDIKSENKEEVLIKRKKMINTKKKLSHYRVLKPKNKEPEFSSLESVEEVKDVKVSYEYVPMTNTDDVKCAIESFDCEPDASIDILKVQTIGYIDHQQIIKMPSNKLVLCNYDENDKKDQLSDDVLDIIMEAKSVEVNYSDYQGMTNKKIDVSTSTDDLNTFIRYDDKKENDKKRKDASVGVNLLPVTCNKSEHDCYCRFKGKQNYGIGTDEMRYDHLMMELQYMANSRDAYKTMYDDLIKELNIQSQIRDINSKDNSKDNSLSFDKG